MYYFLPTSSQRQKELWKKSDWFINPILNFVQYLSNWITFHLVLSLILTRIFLHLLILDFLSKVTQVIISITVKNSVYWTVFFSLISVLSMTLNCSEAPVLECIVIPSLLLPPDPLWHEVVVSTRVPSRGQIKHFEIIRMILNYINTLTLKIFIL